MHNRAANAFMGSIIVVFVAAGFAACGTGDGGGVGVEESALQPPDAGNKPETKPSHCGAGTTKCRGRCENLQSDENNCGACGNVCPGQNLCCGGVCIDVMGSDLNNCGYCGGICFPGVACLNGHCNS